MNKTLKMAQEANSRGIIPLAMVEKEEIEYALLVYKGNKTLAARALGIGRATIYRKIKEHKITL